MGGWAATVRPRDRGRAREGVTMSSARHSAWGGGGGDGSSSTIVENVTGGIYNVTDYDTIQNAINALPANGATLFFPAGAHTLPAAGLTGAIGQVTIRGAGKGNTILN